MPRSTDTPAPVTRGRAWLLAARPKTLPAAIAPVVVGAAAALGEHSFAPLPALAALAGALLLQIGVNLANDYFDFGRGIDTPDRKGPVRVTQAGLIPPGQVRFGMIATFVAAALVGVYLVVRGGTPILVVGVASILSALAYSGGPWPLASHGVADLFVFVFFGPVAVCGTYFVQAGSVSGTAAAASLAPGLLITAILVVNNLRDIETDAGAGKRTLAVRLGVRGLSPSTSCSSEFPFHPAGLSRKRGARPADPAAPARAAAGVPPGKNPRHAARGRPGDERRAGRHRAAVSRLLPPPRRRPGRRPLKKAHLLRWASPSSLRRTARTPQSSGLARLAPGPF